MVEAVFEGPEIKGRASHWLGRLAGERVLLTTNASAIPITAIAATERPETLVGTHFSPMPMMEVCKMIPAMRTSDESLARAHAFAESLGKTAVTVGRDVAGSVTTRLIVAIPTEAARLVEYDMISAADLDVACRLGFRWAMRLAAMDLTGVDVLYRAAMNRCGRTRDPRFLPLERVGTPWSTPVCSVPRLARLLYLRRERQARIRRVRVGHYGGRSVEIAARTCLRVGLARVDHHLRDRPWPGSR